MKLLSWIKHLTLQPFQRIKNTFGEECQASPWVTGDGSKFRLLVLSAHCQAALRGWLLLFGASCLSAAQRSPWSGGSCLQFQFVWQHHSVKPWCTKRAAAHAIEVQQAARGINHSQSFVVNFFPSYKPPLHGFHLGPGEDLFALKLHSLVHIHVIISILNTSSVGI